MTRARVAVAAVLAILFACTGSGGPSVSPTGSSSSRPGGSARGGAPNIVFILTDDQRWDTLNVMPIVQRDLMAHGVTFTNDFVVNSLCCPSRTTILTGRYSHGTGIYTNLPEAGGFQKFDASSTVATWLHRAGYRTALVGKYLNGYGLPYVSDIPPGWDLWYAKLGTRYNRYYVSDQGTAKWFGKAPADYGTEVLGREAVSFIRTTPPNQPLFLYFAPNAPHEPATPAPQDAKAFSNIAPWRPPSYDEANVSDKPAWLRNTPLLSSARKAEIDAVRVNMLRSLQDVDRVVGRLVTTLADTGRLKNTLLVFTSDNGYIWGEHRLKGKETAYDESIRVPLVIRYDPLVRAPRTDARLVANIDFAPTFAGLAGIPAPGVEGRSLVPLLMGSNAPWRSDFLVEHLKDPHTTVPTFCAVRSTQDMFVAYQTGEEELYDLTKDPYELQNRASDPAYASVRSGLLARLRQLCRPPPPGYTVP